MATTAITLDSFPLIGTTPQNGRAKVTGFDGWLSGSLDRSRARRTGMHGSWSSLGWRSGHQLTISGVIVYSSPSAAATERRNLLALGGLGESQLVVTDPLGTLGLAVEVDDVDIAPTRDSMLRFHFEVTAKAPFARSTTPVTFTVAAGATVTPTGSGTFAAEIQVTTTSAGTVVLSASGQTLRTSSLPSGSVLTSGPGFSNPERTVRGPGGEDLFSATLSPMQWPAVSPGANSFVNSGTANLSVTYYPTYA